MQLTLKRLLKKFLTENNTKTYADSIDQLMRSYNSRKHRTIGMSPIEAERPENFAIVSARFAEQYSKLPKKKPKFSVGQLVRLSRQPSPFLRSFNQQSTEEVFVVTKVLDNWKIPTYLVSDYHQTEPIVDPFYGHELIAVSTDTKFRIEEVLQRRPGYKFVKFVGLSNVFNLWIHEDSGPYVKVFGLLQQRR